MKKEESMIYDYVNDYYKLYKDPNDKEIAADFFSYFYKRQTNIA